MRVEEFDKLTDHSPGMDLFYNFALETSKKVDETLPFVEIGVRLGGSSLYLLKAIKDSGKIKRPLVTIDPYGEIPYEFKVGNIKTKAVYTESFYRTALKELSNYCYQNNLLHINFKITSEDFINIFPLIKVWNEGKIIPENFGFVYLDGSHEEKVVAMELDYFLPKVCSGGILVIDDFPAVMDSKIEIIQHTLRNGKHDYFQRMYYFKN